MSILAENLQTVPETATVRVTAAGYLTHECPHVSETDYGTVAVSWTCAGSTIELHSLSRYLDAYEGAPISHERISETIRADVAALDGIADVVVVTKWTTANLEVRVETEAR
jgi:NADPH-dependent 7-cyano-7-deazaguanine reductase QueF